MKHDIFKEVSALSEMDKWKLYFRYLAAHYSLKHCLIITLPEPRKWISFAEGWKEERPLKWDVKCLINYEPVSFKDFCNNDGYFDAGENWKEQGYAQQHIRQCPDNGIYHWYSIGIL